MTMHMSCCAPNFTVKVKVEDMNGFKVFNKFYVFLKACKDTFISCRPIIALDVCFLKGFYVDSSWEGPKRSNATTGICCG